MIENNEVPAEHTIKIGDYIVIQRQNYTKLHKFNSSQSTSMLGKDQIKLENIQGHPYFSTFKMILKDKKKRLFYLEHCKDVHDVKEVFVDRESGADNRNIQDDGQSQMLSTEDITRLKEKDLSSSEIVTYLVENSKTFASKTEYSQEKYLKKKEKKYFEYVQIRRPTIRLLSEIFHRQDPAKVLGLRCDSLTQLLCYANVTSTGSYLLYESGTNGLLPAAILNAIGQNTIGKLVHMHPGNHPQQQGLLALNFPEEQKLRCLSVNIYSVLRHYYQVDIPVADNATETNKRKITAEASDDMNPKKIMKLSDDLEASDIKKEDSTTEMNKNEVVSECNKMSAEIQMDLETSDIKKEEDETDVSTVIVKTPEITEPSDQKINRPSLQGWQMDNKRACEVLRKGLDSLIIAAKEHPLNIVNALLPFVNNSAPVVIFSSAREPLVSLYSDFKQHGNVTGVRITNNWMRSYQVLPNRTHPDVNMGTNGGYLLTGWVVQSKLAS